MQAADSLPPQRDASPKKESQPQTALKMLEKAAADEPAKSSQSDPQDETLFKFSDDRLGPISSRFSFYLASRIYLKFNLFYRLKVFKASLLKIFRGDRASAVTIERTS